MSQTSSGEDLWQCSNPNCPSLAPIPRSTGATFKTCPFCSTLQPTNSDKDSSLQQTPPHSTPHVSNEGVDLVQATSTKTPNKIPPDPKPPSVEGVASSVPPEGAESLGESPLVQEEQLGQVPHPDIATLANEEQGTLPVQRKQASGLNTSTPNPELAIPDSESNVSAERKAEEQIKIVADTSPVQQEAQGANITIPTHSKSSTSVTGEGGSAPAQEQKVGELSPGDEIDDLKSTQLSLADADSNDSEYSGSETTTFSDSDSKDSEGSSSETEYMDAEDNTGERVESKKVMDSSTFQSQSQVDQESDPTSKNSKVKLS